MKRLSLPVICLFAGTILLLLYTSLHGLFFPDEGYILNTAQRILSHQTLYRDFDFVYTPFSAWITTLALAIGGESVLNERILNLLISLFTCWALFRLSQSLAKNIYLALLPCLIFVAWGPMHINFIWPGMLAVEIGILTTVALWFGIQKKHSNFLLLSGIGTVLCLLTKQNLGLALFISQLLTIFFIPQLRKKTFIFTYLKGFFATASLFILYLLATSSLSAFITNMYVNTFQVIILQKSIDTPIFSLNSLNSLAKLLLYTSPVILSLVASLLAFKRDKKMLPLTFPPLFFYLFGFRPVSDYVHLAPLLSLSGIPLLIIISLVKNKIYKRILLFCGVILFGIGLWSALFFGYYRWKPPLVAQQTFVANPRVMIYSDSQTANELTTLTSYLHKTTKPNEKIFLNYYAPMIYFVSGHPNPTRFDYTGLPKNYQQELIKELQINHVTTMISAPLNLNDSSIIGDYLRSNFRFTATVSGYEIWKK